MTNPRFRAWHKKKKAFMYFELSELNDSMITKVDDGWYLEDCELMQYTGLKDNTKWEQLTQEEQKEWLKEHTKEEWSGKETWEGDIVIDIDEDGNEDDFVPQVVCFGERDYEDEHYIGFYFSIDGKKQDGYLSWAFWDRLEVIGNIYENPNLIEKL